MSITLTLNGDSSVLTADYFPPLELNGKYVCGLIDFQTYNSIPNIDEENNLFYIADKTFKIPEGSYEISDIEDYLRKELKSANYQAAFILKANNNTLKSEITSTERIFFDKDNTIGPLLGFSKRELKANATHVSDLPVNIIQVNAIHIDCNIIHGSFINGQRAHTIHEFSPNVAPGYKIVEVPKNVIYLPVNVKRISSLTLEVCDQDGKLINFRGETITVRLHLKPENANV